MPGLIIWFVRILCTSEGKNINDQHSATDGLLTGRERASVGTRVGTSRRLAAQLSTGTSAATEVSHPAAVVDPTLRLAADFETR